MHGLSDKVNISKGIGFYIFRYPWPMAIGEAPLGKHSFGSRSPLPSASCSLPLRHAAPGHGGARYGPRSPPWRYPSASASILHARERDGCESRGGKCVWRSRRVLPAGTATDPPKRTLGNTLNLKFE
jgi:hypothetical protein